MLTLTREAAHAIRQLTNEAPPAAGVRLYADPAPVGQLPPLQVEMTQWPSVEDTVLEAEGARLYVEPETLRVLDHKVLDAREDGGETRFDIFEQAD